MRKRALLLLSVLCSALTGAQPAALRADIGQCAGPTHSGPSPPSVLPAAPAQPLGAASLARVAEAYRRGMASCLENLGSMMDRYELLNQSSAMVPDTDDDENPIYPELWRCKGNAAFYVQTGLVLWPFGPETCEVRSECFVGVLACGAPRGESIARAGGGGGGGSYRGWSLRSVHVQAVVHRAGGEVVAPELQLAAVPFEGAESEALLWRFQLTTAGKFTTDLRLEAWYPGVLHADPAAAFSQAHLHGAEYYGPSGDRCYIDKSCGMIDTYLPRCEKRAHLPHTPVALNSVDTGRCPRLEGGHPLPLCVGSEHDGRYLELPAAADQLCRTKEFETRMRLAVEGKRGSARGAAASRTLNEYARALAEMDPAGIWKQLLREDEWSSMDQDSKSYLEELKRYAIGHPCMVTDIQSSTLSRVRINFNAALFAPYECRYMLYGPDESRECAIAAGANHVVFHGDSMSRDLFSVALNQFSVTQVSMESMKEEMKEAQSGHMQFNRSAITLSELYYWTWRPDLLVKTEETIPDVYITNYALAHAVSIPFGEFEQLVQTQLKSYWSNRKAPPPRVKIFQNARDNHGQRRVYFFGETFRRANQVLRSVLVDELGFRELDEWRLTTPMLETYGDGWHFGGTVRKMETVILVNMICNPS